MKCNEPDLTDELRTLRGEHIQSRWKQLHALSKETGESTIKYLFTTNAGGAVAVLAYLGSVSGNGIPAFSAKIALFFFFCGLLSVGIYQAYMVHNHEGLFVHYKGLVKDYYGEKISWNGLLEADETKVGNSKIPYILGYSAFVFFILGCFAGAFGIF
ncbi:hypothetical protein AVO42_10805 [Thiomicrospira sp. XS5]|uniref:hypothetical protein n=1 Tax=Thiomicrospira sp. XS5 TaxID=1775636 RepID=UPI000749FDA0|nr:hypothetical protein [Thiomicrospira sp. XS5]KUJ75764.1 hypothetical protein AVO42_10805 [Thiomicrospira sp. XS5]